MEQKLVIITAPSGSGKSSIAQGLMQAIPDLQFSISAATRLARDAEINGVHYHFMTSQDFENKIKNNEFAEWEKVYEGKYYGTLKSEITRIWQNNQIPLLDIDVEGAKNIQVAYPTQSISIFIQVPLPDLETRLIARGTETPQSLKERLNKAAIEVEESNKFNHIVVNDNLEKATTKTIKIVQQFLQSTP